MRIISGFLGGRRLKTNLKKWPTRPTTDRARESLFNILANHVDFSEIVFCDLFAGTGLIGLEAISRGCPKVYFVDKFRRSQSHLLEIARDWEVEEQIEFHCLDVRKFVSNIDQTFDLIFMDPPYDYKDYTLIIDLIFEKNLLAKNGFLVVEHDATNNFDQSHYFQERRIYGESQFTLFKN